MTFERATLTALTLALLATPALGQEVDISKGKIKVQGANGERVEIGTDEADDDADEPGEAAAAVTAITGNGKKLKVACAPGKASFTVAGNKNELTLTGDCQHVSVSGNANVVHVERVASISLTGNKNVATYVDGVGGQAPKIVKTGNDNSVKKVPPAR